MKDLYKRLARAEAMADAQKSEIMETLKEAYERACKEHNEEDASVLARKIRNKMLDESDNRMSLDRFELTAPTGVTFTAWLQFFKDFGKIFEGDWAQYRKKLRDLPEQSGFPFEIEFPTPPEELCITAELEANKREPIEKKIY